MGLYSSHQGGPLAVSLCFKLETNHHWTFLFPVASCTQQNPSYIIAMIISPKPFKDLRHRTHQGFSSYRDPPQFITGESLTAVVCDGWFPKLIPILQHVSVVELIFSPLGSGQSCDFFDQ